MKEKSMVEAMVGKMVAWSVEQKEVSKVAC
jgi:hypothetical protein